MWDNVDDTLIAHYAFASHLPKRLDWVVSEYLDASPWKCAHGMRDVGEKGQVIESMGAEELTLYNAQDARLTAMAWGRMGEDVERERAVYRHDLALSKICHEMQWEGIGVDGERKEEIARACEERLRSLRSELATSVGVPGFDPGKLPGIRRILRDAGVERRTPTGEICTDNETLEALAAPDTEVGKFAAALLQWRVVGKIKSTYLDAVVVNPKTRRAHYNWKLGPVTGRLACRFQSVPRYSPKDRKTGNPTPEGRVREIYVPGPGNVFVYFDVSQAEMRLAAFLSADPAFMKVAMESDVHAGNAKQVFPGAASKGWLDGEAKKDDQRGKPYRDIAKNLGFAIAYGAEEEKVFSTLFRKGFPVTMRAVSLILARLRGAYHVYYKFVAENVARVRETGWMRSPILGRVRRLGRHPKPTDVSNYPVQSGLADAVNARMIALAGRAGRLGATLAAQIHDACYYDCPRGKAGELEDMIRGEWAKPIRLKGGDLVLPIDMKRGERMSDL